MWVPYLFVFLGALLFDVVPFPFLPAFTVMIYLQVHYHLEVWAVLFLGVAGSILGRFLLTLYIPLLSGRYFNVSKNEDVKLLGEHLKSRGWQSQAVIVAYSLLPLPTTPLFLAAGMARIRPRYIIPAFFVGKLSSDSVAVAMGQVRLADPGQSAGYCLFLAIHRRPGHQPAVAAGPVVHRLAHPDSATEVYPGVQYFQVNERRWHSRLGCSRPHLLQ